MRLCSSAGRCKAQLRRGSLPVGRRSHATPACTEYCLGYNLPRWAPSSSCSSASATVWDMARAMMISYGWYRHALKQSRHLWVLIWILPRFFELFWSRSYFSGSVLGWSFLMSDNQGSFTLIRTYWSGDGDTRGRVMIEQRRIWAHSNAVLVSSTVCYVVVLYLYLAPLWFVHFHNNSFKSLLLFETAVFLRVTHTHDVFTC